MLQFCPPQPLPEATVKALAEKRRLKPVTLAYLLAKGAEKFAWICPGESLPGLAKVPQAGAFAYVFTKGKLKAALRDGGFDFEANDEDPAGVDRSSDSPVGTRKGTGFGRYLAGKPSCEGCYFPVAT